MWARLARKYFRPSWEKSGPVSGWRRSRAQRAPQADAAGAGGDVADLRPSRRPGRWRVNQSRSRLPLAPTWKRSRPRRATVTSLRMPPSWSSSRVYVTEPTDLSTLPVVSRCRKAAAPGPVTSRRLSAVMSYIATVSRVAWASAPTIGDQYRAAQSSGRGDVAALDAGRRWPRTTAGAPSRSPPGRRRRAPAGGRGRGWCAAGAGAPAAGAGGGCRRPRRSSGSRGPGRTPGRAGAARSG